MVASIERVINPKSGSGALAALAGILAPGGTKAIDTHTVLQPRKAVRRLPVPGELVVVQHGDPAQELRRQLPEEAVGTGPWMLKSFVTNQRATFVKNPNYWGKDAQGRQLPYLDALDFASLLTPRPPTCSSSRAPSTSSPRPCSRAGVGAQRPALRVDVYPSSGIREVAFNVNKKPWQDKRVRQAVAYSLDRQAINQALYGGRSNLGYDTFWEPTVFPGSPTSAVRAQDYTRPSRCSPPPVIRTASTSR